MDYLPLFLDIKNKSCLIVGGGVIAERKVSILSRAQANITVIAPDTTEEIKRKIDANKNTWLEKKFESSDLTANDYQIVIAATDDRTVNAGVAELCRENNILVNTADDSKNCDFILPSIIDRSPVQIAVSTGGASPVLARMLRTKLENCTPASYGHLAKLIEDNRVKVKEKFSTIDERRKFWEQVLQGPISELVFANQTSAAQQLLEDTIQQADKHAIPQENINEMLVRLAKEGKRVLRLKGGDPFIFGRGGEEIASLIDENIPFQIVPGITAAAGCAAYAGIPLTHREYSQAAIFATGHLKDDTVDLNWEMLAHTNQTLVFYMGLHGLQIISDNLIKHGLSAETPAALIMQGTTANQKNIIGNLKNLPELVKQHDVTPPTLVIIGEVVQLHEKLNWFNPEEDVTAGAVKAFGAKT